MIVAAAVTVLAVAQSLAQAAAPSPASISFELNIGWMLASLVLQAVMALAAGLWAASRATTIVKTRLQDLGDRVDEHTSRIDHFGAGLEAARGEIHTARMELLKSEAESGRQFALRGELSRLVADSTSQFRELSQKVDTLGSDLHERITEVAKDFREFKGRQLGIEERKDP